MKSKSTNSSAEHKTVYDSVIQASVVMNTICREGRYSELGTKYKDLLMAMETDDLQERLLRFDEVISVSIIQVCPRLREVCDVYPDVHTRVKRRRLEPLP